MKLHYFPLSPYSQKVLMALFEKEVSFTPQLAELTSPEGRAAIEKLYRMSKIPVLELDDGQVLPESSVMIEYIDGLSDREPRLIPTDRMTALRVRSLDRIVDQYISNQFLKIFFDGRRPAADRDPTGVVEARRTVERAYGLLDAALENATWLGGKDFSLADCAAAPALSYARMLLPFADHKNLSAYAARVIGRPSYQRVQAEAAPYFARLNNP
jgi:glutathione S-transferase